MCYMPIKVKQVGHTRVKSFKGSLENAHLKPCTIIPINGGI